ncbi:MAG: DedA family protein [Planctomycetes bacterium]|nr:DedA family protein [Planctomycetota bacterium]
MTINALYWYVSIFGWLFLTGVGLPPCPEEAGILFAASVDTLHPEVWWPFAWAACGLGIVTADCVLYGVGRRWGPKLFEYRWVQKFLSTQRRQRIEGYFTQHGMKLLVLARFLPPLRTGVFLIAGATRYSFVKFLIADFTYAVVGVGALFFFGTAVLALVHRFESTAVFLAAILVMCYGLFMYYKLLRRRDWTGGTRPPVSVVQGPQGSVPEGEPAKNPTAAPAAKKEAQIALGEG